MIQLTRARTVAAIPKEFRGEGRVTSCKALIELIRSEKDPDSKVWKKAKKQLKAESHGKCAYCESSTSTVAHGDVEHFRPKSVYWWLAYCFDNYTFSCQICNQTYKNSNFPLSGTAAVAPEFADPFTDEALATMAAGLCPDPLDDAALELFRKTVAKEKAHLPDPYEIDPEPLFKWVADDVLQEVEIKAKSTKTASKRAFTAVDEFLGLNREELKRRRYQVYESAKVLADLLKTADLPDDAAELVTTQLQKLMENDAEYAGMVRYFVKAVWKLDLEP